MLPATPVGVMLGLFLAARAGDVEIEDTNPALVYEPSQDSWQQFVNPGPGKDRASCDNYYHGGGYSFTNILGASVSLTFNGSYIAYYSDLYYMHGPMEISLDGKITTITPSYTSLSHGMPQQKLFDAQVDPSVPISSNSPTWCNFSP